MRSVLVDVCKRRYNPSPNQLVLDVVRSVCQYVLYHPPMQLSWELQILQYRLYYSMGFDEIFLVGAHNRLDIDAISFD